MTLSLKRLYLVSIGSLGVALVSGGVIAQQAQPEASQPNSPVSPPPSGPGDVSAPEPAPNSVRERREQQNIDAMGLKKLANSSGMSISGA